MFAPDFLLIGAAKSGTTILWYWLKQHPDVFLPDVKEPGYFAYQNIDPRPKAGLYDPSYFDQIVTRRDDYEILFAERGEKIAGEASPAYLLSPLAAKRIQARAPNCKLIVALRDPVERAFSQFSHHVRDGLETTFKFEEAIELEVERLAAGWSLFYGYERGGHYAAQLMSYLELFSKEQILILDYDAIEKSPETVFQTLCDFLEISPHSPPDFTQRVNESRSAVIPRSARLHRLQNHPNRLKTAVNAVLPKTLRAWLKSLLQKTNQTAKPESSPEFLEKLALHYKDDAVFLMENFGDSAPSWVHNYIKH